MPRSDEPLFPLLDPELFAKLVDPLLDKTAVHFELLFTGAAHADAGFDARQVRPHLLQPRQRVLELGELDRETRFVGLGVAGEDVEDQLGPVEHFDFEAFSKVASLAGMQVVIEDDDVGFVMGDEVFELLDFPLAEIRGHIRLFPPLGQAAGDPGPRRFGQAGDLVERIISFILSGKNNANENCLLARDSFGSFGFVHCAGSLLVLA